MIDNTWSFIGGLRIYWGNKFFIITEFITH
jgi:hypothetical protein